MSHVTRIYTRFTDSDALREAIGELGWAYDPGSGQGIADGEAFTIRPSPDGALHISGVPVEPLRRAYAAIVVRRAAEAAGLRIVTEEPQPDGGHRYVVVPEEE
jgi:hypothetical protein